MTVVWRIAVLTVSAILWLAARAERRRWRVDALAWELEQDYWRAGMGS